MSGRYAYAPKQRTAADQRQEFTLLLWQCRPHMLDSYSLEYLQNRFRKLPAKEVEATLIVVRQKRAGEAR